MECESVSFRMQGEINQVLEYKSKHKFVVRGAQWHKKCCIGMAIWSAKASAFAC
jgi:hypothetical protein